MKSNAFFLFFFLIFLFSCEPSFFTIPTPSMEATIPVGSRIFVNTAKPYKHYDVISFQWPNQDTYTIGRVLGMPGDLFEIRGKEVFRDELPMQDTSTIQHTYLIETKEILNDRIFEDNGISNFTWKNGGYIVNATKHAVEKFKSQSFIDGVVSIADNKGDEDFRLFQDFTGNSWNADHFGPIRIPGKGLTIELNEKNRQLYKTVIENYEGTQSAGLADYTFQKDYIFVMGDNRHNSLDSRFMGFLPVDNIHGVASKYKLF